MLGVPTEDGHAFDGSPIPYTADAISNAQPSELLQVESWTGSGGYQLLPGKLYYNNTYKSLRFITGGNNLFYSVWCNGDKEFYDMVSDPDQMQNRLGSDPPSTNDTYYGRPQAELINRLDAVLLVGKSCKQESCRNPWITLFPSGEVSDLAGAMKAKYDSFFEDQPKVSFSSCKSCHLNLVISLNSSDWQRRSARVHLV